METLYTDEEEILADQHLMDLLKDPDFINGIKKAVYRYHQEQGEQLSMAMAIKKVTNHLKDDRQIKKMLRSYLNDDAKFEKLVECFSVYVVTQITDEAKPKRVERR